MVIQEELQAIVDLAEKPMELEQNECSGGISNVGALPLGEIEELNANLPQEEMDEESEMKTKKRPRDSFKNETTVPLSPSSCSDYEGKPANKISESDLEELRTAYKKCKDIVQKIESTYGHLIDFKTAPSSCNAVNTIKVTDGKCTCKLGKKIVFDESGQEILKERNLSEHICPQKLVRRFSNEYNPQQNLQIEYSEPNEVLPDDLKTLVEILHDSQLDNSYRYRVISKIQFIRQQYGDEIRSNKKSLIEQLTANPYEILGFQGTNLSTIAGYK